MRARQERAMARQRGTPVGSAPARSAYAGAIENMRSFELALLGASNSFARWVVSCAQATGELGLGSTDLLILKMVSREARPKRASEVGYALNIEDVHVVSYALKKLARIGFVDSIKNGKESHFSTTEAGERFLERYDEIRVSCLIDTFNVFAEMDADLRALTQRLRAISGIYEQAARAATAL